MIRGLVNIDVVFLFWPRLENTMICVGSSILFLRCFM